MFHRFYHVSIYLKRLYTAFLLWTNVCCGATGGIGRCISDCEAPPVTRPGTKQTFCHWGPRHSYLSHMKLTVSWTLTHRDMVIHCSGSYYQCSEFDGHTDTKRGCSETQTSSERREHTEYSDTRTTTTLIPGTTNSDIQTTGNRRTSRMYSPITSTPGTPSTLGLYVSITSTTAHTWTLTNVVTSKTKSIPTTQIRRTTTVEITSTTIKEITSTLPSESTNPPTSETTSTSTSETTSTQTSETTSTSTSESTSTSTSELKSTSTPESTSTSTSELKSTSTSELKSTSTSESTSTSTSESTSTSTSELKSTSTSESTSTSTSDITIKHTTEITSTHTTEITNTPTSKIPPTKITSTPTKTEFRKDFFLSSESENKVFTFESRDMQKTLRKVKSVISLKVNTRCSDYKPRFTCDKGRVYLLCKGGHYIHVAVLRRNNVLDIDKRIPFKDKEFKEFSDDINCVNSISDKELKEFCFDIGKTMEAFSVDTDHGVLIALDHHHLVRCGMRGAYGIRQCQTMKRLKQPWAFLADKRAGRIYYLSRNNKCLISVTYNAKDERIFTNTKGLKDFCLAYTGSMNIYGVTQGRVYHYVLKSGGLLVKKETTTLRRRLAAMIYIWRVGGKTVITDNNRGLFYMDGKKQVDLYPRWEVTRFDQIIIPIE